MQAVAQRGRCAAALLALAACAVADAQAAPVAFGKRTLEIPAPTGFVAVAKISPELLRLSEGYLPAGNRLVEIYLSEDEAAALARGEGAQMQRYFQLQVMRSVDGQPISAEEFSTASKQVEDGIRETIPSLAAEYGDIAAKGNAQVKDAVGVDPGVELGPATYLGAFRREPWGTFFTIALTVASGDAASRSDERTVGASALVLVNHQVLYLYSYNDYGSEADRRWAEGAVSAWADAVRRANADDPAVAREASRSWFDRGGIARSAMVGGAIGFVIALLGFGARRWRKPS